MRAIAKERGGKRVSKTYVNSSTRLKWERAWPPLVRYVEHDPSRALVRALLFHQHYDDREDASKAAT